MVKILLYTLWMCKILAHFKPFLIDLFFLFYKVHVKYLTVRSD
jgi:hypothetical protein